jgi:tetratricopeptide (TPR) repeat protein
MIQYYTKMKLFIMNLNFRTISPAIYLYGMLVGFMLISCPNQVPASNIYSIAKEAEAEFQSGRYKSALEKFQKALSLNRDYLPAILGLGKT